MGGAETSLIELLASVRTARPKWHLSLVLGADGPLAGRATALGVSVHVLPMPPAMARLGDSSAKKRLPLLSGLPAAALYVRRLARAVRAERPDLIHATGFKMHLLSAWTRPRRTPLIWHIHDYVQSRPVMSRLLRWHAGQCAAAIVNSKSVGSDVRMALGQDLRVETIYNAIDLRRFSPDGAMVDLDALSGLPQAEPGTIRVGLVATFAHWKGHLTFLKALAMIPPEARVRGYIIGGAIYQTIGSQHSLDDLRLEAVRLGLGNRLGFTGFVDDTASAMRALDIVVHASTSPEPFGMVIVEGMACGKPVIASEAGGAMELFEDGVDALGHPPNDAFALASQIARLAHDEQLRARIGRAGREKAEAAFKRDRLALELTAIYQQFCDRLPRTGAVALSARY